MGFTVAKTHCNLEAIGDDRRRLGSDQQDFQAFLPVDMSSMQLTRTPIIIPSFKQASCFFNSASRSFALSSLAPHARCSLLSRDPAYAVVEIVASIGAHHRLRECSRVPRWTSANRQNRCILNKRDGSIVQEGLKSHGGRMGCWALWLLQLLLCCSSVQVDVAHIGCLREL